MARTAHPRGSLWVWRHGSAGPTLGGACITAMHPRMGRYIMFDYLRIMLDARLAKLDERGASAVEYGLLIAGIAALIVVVVFAFGGVIKNIFQTTCNSVGASSGGTC